MAIEFFARQMGYTEPGIAMVLVLASAIFAWRRRMATDRACAAALVLTMALHAMAWLVYGPSLPLHLLCDLIGMSLLLPTALTSRRHYPVALFATWLFSALVQMLGIWVGGPSQAAAGPAVGLANLALLGVLWIGLVRTSKTAGARKVA